MTKLRVVVEILEKGKRHKTVVEGPWHGVPEGMTVTRAVQFVFASAEEELPGKVDKPHRD